MTDEQLLLSSTVRGILAGAVDDMVDGHSNWPSRRWAELENAGMTGVGIDEQLGGSGGALSDVELVVFECGRSAARIPLPETTMFAGWLNSAVGWQWSGRAETVGIAEAGDVIVRTSGADLLLDGRITSVPWGRFAHRMTAVIPVGDALLLAQLDPQTVVVEAEENLAGEYRDTVVLDSVRIKNDNWIDLPMSLADVKLRGALMRAIASLGSLSRIVDFTVAYAGDREQFGRSINSFQAVQQLIARLGSELFASSTSIRSAVTAVERGGGALESMAAVVRVSQAATNAARIAHQVHGAIGVTEEYSLHHYTNRIWCWRNEYGGQAAWSRAIVDHVRDRSHSEDIWAQLTTNDPGGLS